MYVTQHGQPRQRTCAKQEHAYVVYRARGWELEYRVRLVDLLEIGLEGAACD